VVISVQLSRIQPLKMLYTELQKH